MEPLPNNIMHSLPRILSCAFSPFCFTFLLLPPFNFDTSTTNYCCYWFYCFCYKPQHARPPPTIPQSMSDNYSPTAATVLCSWWMVPSLRRPDPNNHNIIIIITIIININIHTLPLRLPPRPPFPPPSPLLLLPRPLPPRRSSALVAPMTGSSIVRLSSSYI